MGAEARIAKLEKMRESRIGPNGLALKGYVKNVEAIDIELHRLRRTGEDHPPVAKHNQHNPKDVCKPRIPKQPPPRIAVRAAPPAPPAAEHVADPKPIFRPPSIKRSDSP